MSELKVISFCLKSFSKYNPNYGSSFFSKLFLNNQHHYWMLNTETLLTTQKENYTLFTLICTNPKLRVANGWRKSYQ